MAEKFDKSGSLDKAGGKEPVRQSSEACQGNIESLPATAGETQIFPFDSQALTQLAVGSAIVIACVLALTDVIPLLPNARSVISLALRIVGDWIVVAITWFLGFLGITQTLRLVSRGVAVNDHGIKLSRFDRIIPWTSVEAVQIAPNPFFSKLFSLPTTARRITILFHFEVKNKFFARLLFPNYISSFFFSKETFDKLICEVFSRTSLLPSEAELPDNYAVTAVRPGSAASVGTTFGWLRKQQIIVSVIVVLGLFNFLGRKALSYYCFNSAGKAMTVANFELARDYYRWSLKWEPAFAAGWNGLGQSEFRLAEMSRGDFAPAERDWHRAILFKPDFVEPRLNIARLCIYRRHFDQAEALVEQALNFAPENDLALIERAELAIRSGKYKDAERDSRLVLSQNTDFLQRNIEYRFKAKCLLAQAALAQGDTSGAMVHIEKYSPDPSSYHDGEDVTSFLVLRARILLALGRTADACHDIDLALARHPFNQEVLATAAQVYIADKKFERAKFLLARLRQSGVQNPWMYFLLGELARANGKWGEALLCYEQGTLCSAGSQDREVLDLFIARLQDCLGSHTTSAQDKAGIEQAISSCRRYKASLAR